MNTTPVRIAVIGAGVIGNVHARALTELDTVDLVAIADLDEAKAATLAAKYGVKESTTDVEGLLQRGDIDAVTICTPSGVHADLAVAALNAGKHVVVEKPIDVSLEAADRVIAAEAASGKVVTVITQHRFDRSTEKVTQAVKDGNLGRITSAISSHAWWRGQTYYDSGDWRGTWAMDGGGATMNQTVHTIDLLVSILGVPIEVFAYTACLAHERIEVEDTAVAVVKFASGALGIIHATTAAYPGLDASLRIYGSKGSAVISDDDLIFLHENTGDAAEIGMSEGIVDDLNQAGDDYRVDKAEGVLGAAHRAQLADFAAAITNGTPVRVTTTAARTSLSVILAMYESAATGQPVKL